MTSDSNSISGIQPPNAQKPGKSKRVFWPLVIPLATVLLGIYQVPFAWRELRADITAMSTKPLYRNVENLPSMTIDEWNQAVVKLTKSIKYQPLHPDQLTMLGRLYIVRASGLPEGKERLTFATVAQNYLRLALRERPFHLETLALLKESDELLEIVPME